MESNRDFLFAVDRHRRLLKRDLNFEERRRRDLELHQATISAYHNMPKAQKISFAEQMRNKKLEDKLR